jgi:hypothetical protein
LLFLQKQTYSKIKDRVGEKVVYNILLGSEVREGIEDAIEQLELGGGF